MNQTAYPTTQQLIAQFAGEPNYSDPNADDFDALSRDRVVVRSLAPADLDAIVAIDRRITGHDRTAYYRRKVAEVIDEAGVRVSLVAEYQQRAVGFVMARVDYGEFGQTVTTAVIDSLGVDLSVRGKQVGKALLSQLLMNLGSLCVDTVRTEIRWDDFALGAFLARCGFRPAQELALRCKLES